MPAQPAPTPPTEAGETVEVQGGFRVASKCRRGRKEAQEAVGDTVGPVEWKLNDIINCDFPIFLRFSSVFYVSFVVIVILANPYCASMNP